MKKIKPSTQHELQQAFSVNATVFFAIFAIINGLMDEGFKKHHQNLVVLFATLRLLLGFGVILPEKAKDILQHSNGKASV